MIKDAIDQRFHGKWRMEDPNLAVAKGASLYSAMVVQEQQASGAAPAGGDQPQSARPALPPGIKSLKAQDKTPRSIGPGVMFGDDYMIDNLIFVGEDIPKETVAEYGTVQDNQQAIILRVFENFEDTPQKPVVPCIGRDGAEQPAEPGVKKIGELNLELQPNTPQGSPIEVYFKLDASGLYVRATDKRTGKTVDATLDMKNTMSSEELQAAISQMAEIKTSGESDWG
jgi:molecular chaperone DnaK (HSP70)